MKEFINGKWYKVWFDKDQLFAKYKESISWFCFTEYIRKSEGHCIYNGSWELPKNLVEATMEEISKYLPDGHPDKFTSVVDVKLKEARLKYPVGTKFICLNTEVEAEITTADFEITSSGGINEYINGLLAKTDGFYHCIHSSGKWAEIIESKKEYINTFKQGDKVKTSKGEGIVIAKQKDGEHYLVEHLENIAGHTGGDVSMEWGNTGKDSHCWWYLSNMITLLPNIEPYTVGGYIKVLAGYGNVGKVGKITKIVGNREIHTDIDYTSIEKAYFIKDTECEWIGMEKPVDIVVWDYKELRPEPTSEEFMKELEKSRHYFVDASDLVDKYGWEIPTPKKYDEEVLKQYVFGYDPFPKDELEFQEPVLIKKRKKSQLITI